MIKISCCINTYKRPKLLKKLLGSINIQQIDNTISLEIIVVDNDPDELGREVILEFKPISKFEIKYFVQPEKNISLTRNMAVNQASGEYILFIDDDGYADKHWIRLMVKCLLDYKADAVFGRVISYFDEDTPSWIKKTEFFHRPVQSTGNSPDFTRTGNCLIKTDIIKSVDGPFDLNYGLTGGSDTHLFTALSAAGAKYVSCKEAIVYDYIPPERANIKWLIQRSFRTGNSYTRRVIEYSNHHFATRLWLLLKAIIFSLISLLLIILNLPSRKGFINWILKLVGNLGHIMAIFNLHYVEYR